MSLPYVVSVVGNAMKQRAPFKSLILTNMKQCVSNVGLRNTNRLCRCETTNFYATHVRDKRLSLNSSDSDLQANSFESFRCYSLDSAEFDREQAENEKLPDSHGPVRMTITEEGKLQVNTTVNDVVNNNNNNNLEKSVKSKLKELINENQIECATEFLELTVKLLIKKLSRNGSVESLLHLQHFLLDNNLYSCNEIHFLKSLRTVFHESGRIKDAIHYLRTLCKNNQDYSKFQNIFMCLTPMILKKFPQFQSDIVSIVNEYKVSRFPQLERELWKCFILSENFKEAENYMKEIQNIKGDLPKLFEDINSIIRNSNGIEDQEQVRRYLLIAGEDWGLKKWFLLVIYENYLVSLCE
ncbi:hypothetical protein LOTGIDRAFT_169710 [Lottia gigantea]|uniref:Uncharacterized protein n=1 Tax=Lottia gigantea TaxID=225164 RepID=V3ZKZ6_LOTGI|nr:hypothetical protein LOTGIDRAFT_169710 [Lottia gigantea]ESO83075.1 hypothetical protein LOTGIDRAFT_169710 [Lottia gigantea]